MYHATNALPKIVGLRDDMREKGWTINIFNLNFNGHDYYVLFEDAKNIGKGDKYTIAILTFRDQTALDRLLEVRANTSGIDGDDEKIIEYFGINPYGNGPGFGQTLYESLTRDMPEKFNEKIVRENKDIVLDRLNSRLDERARGPYCFAVRRLPIVDERQQTRSAYIDNKTRMIRQALYDELDAAHDNTITFCYSDDSEKERGDELILKDFSA